MPSNTALLKIMLNDRQMQPDERGYIPPPMPPKPKVEKCPYCGRPKSQCGCGASK